MTITTISELGKVLLSLRQYKIMPPLVQQNDTGKFCPAFTNGISNSDTIWYDMRPELSKVVGEVSFKRNASNGSNDSEVFITYTVEAGFGYCMLIELTEVDEAFAECKVKDDFELVVRELLVSNGFSQSPALDMLKASMFFSKTFELRNMLAETMQKFPTLSDATADECRELSKSFNAFFDNFYKKLDMLGFNKQAVTPLLTDQDIRVYIPALRKAYSEYVKGFIPRLNYYVNPPIIELNVYSG